MKNLVVLGATGSIGASTLDIVDRHPERFRVVALAAGRNVDRLADLTARFRPEVVAVADAEAAAALRSRIDARVHVVDGGDALAQAARHPDADLVVNGLVGAVGLAPTWAAVDAGTDVALANKEALVAGGALVTDRAERTGAKILPVDSEHNAIHQCLRGESSAEVRRLWLTASGGPFRTRSVAELARVTPAEALRHPTWVMGPKITVDSATLMNKGLEVIEARWLFGIPEDRIRVVLHPTSVVHSMVEFVDGSFKAQLGVTDMRHPIQYALTWPLRMETALEPFDPVAASPLEFFEPDPERFRCLGLARQALAAGGTAPAVLNAANEVAVDAFLRGRLEFLEIPALIARALDRHGDGPANTLDDILDADRRARTFAAQVLTDGVQS